jgi:hypothetical protein
MIFPSIPSAVDAYLKYRERGGVVNLTTYRRKEALLAAFKPQLLDAILPWRQFEVREVCGGRSDG